MKVLRYAIAAFTLILLSSGLHIFLNDADKVFEKQAAKTQRILSAVERSFSDFYANEPLHLKLANRTFSEPDLQQFEKCNFEVFVYKEGVSTYWSTNEVQINYVLDKVSEIPALFELKNGYYILQKKQFENCDIILAHLIKYNYSIENKFLRNKFHAIYPLSPTVEVTVPDSGSVNLSFFEKPVFGLMPTQGFLAEMAPQNIVAGYTAIFSLLSMLVLLVVLIVKVNGYGVGLVVWLLLFFLIRGLFYLMPSAIYATPIFSPELYASVVFGASLGMFLIQTIWFLVLSIIIYGYFKTRKFKVKNSVLWLLTVGVVVSTVLLAQGLKSIVLDSVISYKINTFTELNNYTLIGLYLIAFAVLGVYILLRTFINVLAQHSNKHLYVGAQAALIVGTLFLLGFSWLSVVFGVSYTVLALLLMYLKSMAREQSFFSQYLVVVFFASLIIALCINQYNHEKDSARKLQVASQLANQKDLIAEYTFDEKLKEIKVDPFIKKYFTSPFISNKELFQRINYLYFGGYFSKYNVEIKAFNSEGKMMKSSEMDSISAYLSRFKIVQSDEFSSRLVFLSKDDGSFHYVSLIPIESGEKTIGFLTFILSPKKFQRENLYPELLIEDKNKPIVEIDLEIYDYAIYTNGILSAQAGDYPYPYQSDFRMPNDAGSVYFKKNKYQHLTYQDNENKIIVVSSPLPSALIPFSIFSYVFFFIILNSFLVWLAAKIFSKIYLKKDLPWTKSSFRYKINLSILGVIVSSFVIIGFTTISYFAQEYEEYHRQNLIQKQKSILSNIENILHENMRSEKQLSIQEFFQSAISAELRSMADINTIDINIFSPEGKLIVSSQPGIFSSGLISLKIHPRAYEKVIINKAERLIQDEKIGRLNFLSAYIPIRTEKGEIVAYLNLPYFNKENSFVKEVSEFVVAFINVYVLLLVVASILGLLISNSITGSLAQIGEKLSEVNISRKNEFLTWDADDEIGALVKEYNKMIAQLEEGAQVLARSERESAWREMARQIAHEIKNPLTPMKLSIQHLQRAIKDDPQRGIELAPKVAQNLIEQIDNLSDIATAFSSFAQMPKPDKEVVELLPLIENVAQLFATDTGVKIEVNSEVENPRIFADKNQMLSVFNNLIKNAIQAVEEKNDGHISIRLFADEQFYTIRVSDNGVGISEEMKQKVFVPNFTTKSSGTGLGLAISKQIVENFGGAISFESEEGKGTDFYVKLPIYS